MSLETSLEPAAPAGARRRAGGAALRGFLYPALALGALFLLWEVLVVTLRVPGYLLPAPSKVVLRLVQAAGQLGAHALVTGVEILLGFLMAVVVSFPLAVAIVYSRTLERVLYPVLVFFQTVPKIAIAPLFVVWFGVSTFPKVLVAFLIAFFPVVIDSVVGLRTVQPEMIYLVRSMGAGQAQIFLKVRLPASLPFVFSGLKVAATLAVVGAIVGEFVGADRGLGYLLLVANGNLDTTLLFAALTVLTVIGLAVFYLLELLERVSIPWHVSQHGGSESSRATM